MIEQNKNWGLKSFIPLLTFLAVYLGAGVVFSLMGTENPFKQISREFAVLCGLTTVILLSRSRKNIDLNIDLVAKHCGEPGVMLMIMIFALAGAFSGAAEAMGGTEAAVNFGLSIIPRQFVFAGVFVISSALGLATGTSMGTIAAIGPIALGIAEEADLSAGVAIAAVIGGGMFGDNLSVISDTTIAAVRTQGCEMKDKFRMNFLIVLPAAIITLLIFVALTWGGSGQVEVEAYSFWKVLPYLVVLVGALIGVNVFVILMLGTALSLVVGVASGAFAWTQVFAVMGTGVTSMYDITVISIIVACIGALVKEHGGIQWLIEFIHRRVKSKKGAQLGIAGLVAAVDVATANNTVAIVMSGAIAKEISEEYHIDARRSASLLDIFASVMQGILPYGAQLLYASAGTGVAALEIVPYMFYCYLMAVCAIVFILFFSGREK